MLAVYVAIQHCEPAVHNADIIEGVLNRRLLLPLCTGKSAVQILYM